MSTAENEKSASEQADSSELSPLEGGRWRPVRPDELLRKTAPNSTELEPQSDAQSGPPPKVRLERRQELEHHLKSSPTDLDGFMELGPSFLLAKLKLISNLRRTPHSPDGSACHVFCIIQIMVITKPR